MLAGMEDGKNSHVEESNTRNVETETQPATKKLKDLHSFPTNLNAHNLYYSMKHKERGLVIIFNHESYDVIDGETMDPRYGTNTDVYNLCKTFKSLGFAPDVHNNLTYAEIISHCKTVSKKQELKDYDCLIVIILTHGHEQETVFAKDTKYNSKEVVELFVGDNCPLLHNKPKLFFIQACKGVKFQEQIHMRVVTDSSVMRDPTKCVMYSIPRNSDVLIAYATLEGFVALRSPFWGSPYVTQLCYELEKHGKTRDLLSTLIHVHHSLAMATFIYDIDEKNSVEIKVQPSFLCYLNRFLIFEEQPKPVPHSQ